MLRVSIHAGPLAKISRSNRLDWLDIGYQKLAPAADYKIVLFKIGEGALPPVGLPSYPRWSASLWDLAARSIARSLFPVTAPIPAPKGGQLRSNTLAPAGARQKKGPLLLSPGPISSTRCRSV
jgi:hypothetical protein